MDESSDQLSIDRPILRIVAQFYVEKVYFNMSSFDKIFHLWRSFGKNWVIVGWAAKSKDSNCCESYVVWSKKVELTGNHNGTTDYDYVFFEIRPVEPSLSSSIFINPHK